MLAYQLLGSGFLFASGASYLESITAVQEVMWNSDPGLAFVLVRASEDVVQNTASWDMNEPHSPNVFELMLFSAKFRLLVCVIDPHMFIIPRR